MGGGDLNLKKSWHPSTLRNIERVWKAEQKHEVEKQKIEQLQKELAEERNREEIQTFAENQGVVKKKEERLDWMYQGPAAMVNREEYLLGRKIDKTLESIQSIENGAEPPKDEEATGSMMFSSQNLSGTATVDLATKIREDPLFNIMKKEKEERKNLLSNPVKMKQLQQLLKESLGDKKSKKNKKSKKKKHHKSDSDEEKEEKKHKKHKKSASSDSDEEETYSNLKKKNHLKHNFSEKEDMSSERKRSKYDSENIDVSERRHKKMYSPPTERESNRRSYEHKKSSKSDYDHSAREMNHSSSREYNDYSSREFNHPSSRESNHYSSRESNYNSSRESNYKSSRESNYNSSRESNHHSSKESNHHSSKESYHYSSKESYHYSSRDSNFKSTTSRSQDSKIQRRQENQNHKEEKKKLGKEERERLLREMQENAEWRADQRKRNAQRHREENEKEENTQKVDPSVFVKPMLYKLTGKSVENRIKQKIFTIQRSSSDMDKNFARRD